MHPDSCESRGVFAGANREAARRYIGRGRRWRIRSSLRMFAAASLIACSLVLYGCGGGGRAPVATPEGGGPATTPPPATIPPPDTDAPARADAPTGADSADAPATSSAPGGFDAPAGCNAATSYLAGSAVIPGAPAA